MSTKRVLVVGPTGLVGHHIVPALLQRGHKVHALVRPETLASQDPSKRALVSELARRGVVIHEGSLDDQDSLVRACKNADVVVSAVGPGAMAAQTKLVDAIVSAGNVERFIPSEYGGDPKLSEVGRVWMFDQKAQVQDYIEQAGVPHTYVYSNCLASHWAVALGQAGTEPPTEAVTILGDGTVGAAITTLEDNARFVAATVDDPRTLDKAISILGSPITQSELVDHWESRTGTKLERVFVPAAHVDGLIAEAQGDESRLVEVIMTQLGRAVWIDGAAGKLGDGVLDATRLYPEINQESPRAFLDRLRASQPFDTLSAAVRGYVQGVRAADPQAVAKNFAKDYRSEQPAHPQLAFTGREMVAHNYEKLFTNARQVDMRVPRFTVSPADADGVAQHWLEAEVDVHRNNGTVDYYSGVLVLGATDAEIRWGRVYFEPVEPVSD